MEAPADEPVTVEDTTTSGGETAEPTAGDTGGTETTTE